MAKLVPPCRDERRHVLPSISRMPALTTVKRRAFARLSPTASTGRHVRKSTPREKAKALKKHQ
jgi:hypothetical protein